MPCRRPRAGRNLLGRDARPAGPDDQVPRPLLRRRGGDELPATLAALPATWPTGMRYSDGPLDGYALGTIPVRGDRGVVVATLAASVAFRRPPRRPRDSARRAGHHRTGLRAPRPERPRDPPFGAAQWRCVLLTFLYTNCPDVCPLVASNLNAVLRSLPAAQITQPGARARRQRRPSARHPAGSARVRPRAHALLPQPHYLVGAAGGSCGRSGRPTTWLCSRGTPRRPSTRPTCC